MFAKRTYLSGILLSLLNSSKCWILYKYSFQIYTIYVQSYKSHQICFKCLHTEPSCKDITINSEYVHCNNAYDMFSLLQLTKLDTGVQMGTSDYSLDSNMQISNHCSILTVLQAVIFKVSHIRACTILRTYHCRHTSLVQLRNRLPFINFSVLFINKIYK